ncbi:MAG: peroxidase, partial [Gemmatimonadota bacterium]|nr:peroxidase [Gemmatimonadota bacterium]
MSHGSHLSDILAPRSRFYQGPFGRICPDLAPWHPEVPDLDAHLLQVSDQQMLELPGKTPGEIASDPALIAQLEGRFGSGTPAGYTYFGQFIDHDITFDPTSSLMRSNDPDRLLNFRTPRLDLDNVYGRGPADQPYLYDEESNHRKLLVGRVEGTALRDLPRNSQGRALIGDMRNDENSMVSQLQLAFLLAHNELVDRATAAGATDPFEAARRTLRWLYQYIVWYDFVARVTMDKIHSCALVLESLCGGRKGWTPGLRDVYQWKHDPFMP